MPRFTLRTMLGWVAAAAFACYFVLETGSPQNDFVEFLVGTTVSAAIGVGAVRRPWRSLALALTICGIAPAIEHGGNAAALAALGSIIGWLFGAPAGWYARSRALWRTQSTRVGPGMSGG